MPVPYGTTGFVEVLSAKLTDGRVAGLESYVGAAGE
jgi:hypothetical protein